MNHTTTNYDDYCCLTTCSLTTVADCGCCWSWKINFRRLGTGCAFFRYFCGLPEQSSIITSWIIKIDAGSIHQYWSLPGPLNSFGNLIKDFLEPSLFRMAFFHDGLALHKNGKRCWMNWYISSNFSRLFVELWIAVADHFEGLASFTLRKATALIKEEKRFFFLTERQSVRFNCQLSFQLIRFNSQSSHLPLWFYDSNIIKLYYCHKSWRKMLITNSL